MKMTHIVDMQTFITRTEREKKSRDCYLKPGGPAKKIINCYNETQINQQSLQAVNLLTSVDVSLENYQFPWGQISPIIARVIHLRQCFGGNKNANDISTLTKQIIAREIPGIREISSILMGHFRDDLLDVFRST